MSALEVLASGDRVVISPVTARLQMPLEASVVVDQTSVETSTLDAGMVHQNKKCHGQNVSTGTVTKSKEGTP